MEEMDMWETRTAKAYKLLFNAITDALELMDKGHYGVAREYLKLAQQEGEEVFIDD